MIDVTRTTNQTEEKPTSLVGRARALQSVYWHCKPLSVATQSNERKQELSLDKVMNRPSKERGEELTAFDDASRAGADIVLARVADIVVVVAIAGCHYNIESRGHFTCTLSNGKDENQTYMGYRRCRPSESQRWQERRRRVQRRERKMRRRTA